MWTLSDKNYKGIILDRVSNIVKILKIKIELNR